MGQPRPSHLPLFARALRGPGGVPVEAGICQARTLLRRGRSGVGGPNLRTIRRWHLSLRGRGLDAGGDGAGFLDAQASARPAPGHGGPLGWFAWREPLGGRLAPPGSTVRFQPAPRPVEGLRRQYNEPLLRLPVPAPSIY